MSFDGKNDHNKLPLWMKTLFDTKAVDAWSEDPDYSQQCKGSDTTGKMKYTQRMFKRITVEYNWGSPLLYILETLVDE